MISSAILYIVPGKYKDVLAGNGGICDLNSKHTDVLNEPESTTDRWSGWEPQAVDGQKVLPFVVAAPAFDKIEDIKVKSGLLCVTITAYDTFGRRDIEQMPVGAAQFAFGKSVSDVRMNQITRMDFRPRRRILHFIDPGQ